jgi:uncharacterized protein
MACWLTRSVILLLLVLSFSLHAAPEFPGLDDRVVDTAGLLTSETREALIGELAAHEQASSNQVVVVTLTSLQGYSIDDYGYQLGRHWGIGQKKRDNGVLLIIAPKERKVRIEVGYGLEGTLTDALSHNIIQTVKLPEFKKGDMAQGIVSGARAIVQALEGSFEPLPEKKKAKEPGGGIFMALVFLFGFGQLLRGFFKSRLPASVIAGSAAFIIGWLLSGFILLAIAAGIIMFILLFFMDDSGPGGPGRGGYYGSGYSSGGYSGGGFSGGGGSFGGGGSSGSW